MIRTLNVVVMLLSGMFICISHAVAQGADHAAAEPVISRMCLWNADRATWKQLDAKRKQIKLLNEIKLKYPAVIGGQWDVESENDDEVAPQVGNERHTTGAPLNNRPAQPALASDAQAKAPPQPALSRMQAELRAVLTPRQLRAWAERCGDRYSKLPELRKVSNPVWP